MTITKAYGVLRQGSIEIDLDGDLFSADNGPYRPIAELAAFVQVEDLSYHKGNRMGVVCGDLDPEEACLGFELSDGTEVVFDGDDPEQSRKLHAFFSQFK